MVTNCSGRALQVFAFYNDRGECENRIEEFKNGFRCDRLSCHRFLANAFRLLLHAAAYNLVNLFRLQLPQPWRSGRQQPAFELGVVEQAGVAEHPTRSERPYRESERHL